MNLNPRFRKLSTVSSPTGDLQCNQGTCMWRPENLNVWNIPTSCVAVPELPCTWWSSLKGEYWAVWSVFDSSPPPLLLFLLLLDFITRPHIFPEYCCIYSDGVWCVPVPPSIHKNIAIRAVWSGYLSNNYKSIERATISNMFWITDRLYEWIGLVGPIQCYHDQNRAPLLCYVILWQIQIFSLSSFSRILHKISCKYHLQRKSNTSDGCARKARQNQL